MIEIVRKHQEQIRLLLNLLFVLYAALLPFSYAFTVFTGPLLILIFWILEGDLKTKRQKILSQKALVFLLLFFLFTLLSLLWSSDWQSAFRILIFYFAMTIVSTALYTSLLPKFVKPVLYAFLLSMFVSEVLLYGVFLEWWHFKKASIINPSPIMHHTLYSIFVAVTVLLLLGQMFDKTVPKTIKILELFFLASTIVNLFLNGGRTGQIGFLIAIFVFTITYFGFRKKYLLRTFAAAVILFIGAYFSSPIFHQRVHQGILDIQGIVHGNFHSSWGLRMVMSKAGLQMLAEHPLVGFGVGDVMDEFHRFARRRCDLKPFHFLTYNTHVHEEWLQIALQTGLIGLSLFILFIYYLFRTPIDDPLTKALFYAVLTIFLFSFFTDVPLRKYTAGLFGFIIGYFLAQTNDKREKNYS